MAFGKNKNTSKPASKPQAPAPKAQEKEQLPAAFGRLAFIDEATDRSGKALGFVSRIAINSLVRDGEGNVVQGDDGHAATKLERFTATKGSKVFDGENLVTISGNEEILEALQKKVVKVIFNEKQTDDGKYTNRYIVAVYPYTKKDAA